MNGSERWSPSVRPGVIAVITAGLVVGAVCLGDDLQNRQLLENLPRDRRTTLAENLARFDRLSGAEQTAIRRLDKTIEETDPVEQARYRTLLHQYHLWFQGLPEDQQENLLAITDLDERFRAARKLRLAESGGPKRDGPRIAKIRTGDYGMIGPYETAFFLKVWRELPPEQRAEIGKKAPAKLRDELRGQAKTAKVKFDPFPTDLEKLYDEKLEKDDEFKPLIEPMIRRVEQAIRKGEPATKADNAQKKFEHSFAEFRYFEENRPQPVDVARLTRFAESCPDWFHAMTDSLAADDARDYYTTVYRLIYPSPAEMPEPSKAAKTPGDAASKKTPRAKPDPNPPAF